jgi:type III pantothenate kinase
MILVLDIGNSESTGVFDDERCAASSAVHAGREHLTSSGCSAGRRCAETSTRGDLAVAICIGRAGHGPFGAQRQHEVLDLRPFLLEPGVRGPQHPLPEPARVGSDRVAGAIAAAKLFPGQNAIIVDFGTATTIDALTGGRDYLGGIILPGLRLAMEGLDAPHARLPVEIRKPPELLRRSTVESIQAGLYYGNIAILKHLCAEIRAQHFAGKPTVLVGTGGFARLFEDEKIFDAHVPELVLIGLREALRLNS